MERVVALRTHPLQIEFHQRNTAGFRVPKSVSRCSAAIPRTRCASTGKPHVLSAFLSSTDTGNKDVSMLERMKKMKRSGSEGVLARIEMAEMPGPKSGPRNTGGLKPKGRGLLPGIAGLAAGPVGGSTAKDGEAISETAAMVEPNLDVARKGGGQGELCRICDSACLARFPATPANVQVVRAPAGLEQLRAEAHGYRLGRARRRGCRDACALRAAAGPRQHASACTFGGPASRLRPVPAPAAGGQACSVYCAHAPAFLAAHAALGCGDLIAHMRF
mmetsp:Transcript_30853/g.97005  ORF Transcript_30853/g.97005 Transcript_30853/m.97005 type:complete len:275 (+) Transcript_30853:640-1464(+)